MRLRGAVALVTGGSSGIGAATARALAEAGARPLIAGRDRGRLAAVARQTGGLALEADLGSADGAATLAEAAVRAAESLSPGPASGIDILINNAGVGWSGPIGEMTAEKVAELVAVNLTAPIQLTRLLVPGMAARGWGRVVFVSSIAGATGVRGEAVYSAAKAGLGFFAESLSYELSGRGVGVSLIVPGVIDTPFFERRGRPYGRTKPQPIPAERVAQAITSAIARDAAVVYVPRWMRLPAWLHGAAPGTFRILAGRFGDPG
jgi:NAD(P)-dependent dehydrogenase (short-subunit alcohol dehydrogenase family)